MLAPASSPGQKKEKRWQRREGGGGEKGRRLARIQKRGGEGEVMVRKTDYLSNFYYHFSTSCPLSAHCFILHSLSLLSNEWQ